MKRRGPSLNWQVKEEVMSCRVSWSRKNEDGVISH